MSVLEIRDAAGASKYLSCTGVGTELDPLIPKRTDGTSASTVKVVTVTGLTAGTDIWVPANGLQVKVRSFNLTFQTGSVTGDAVAVLEYYTGAAWAQLLRLGDTLQKFVSGNHTFVGSVTTDTGDGVAPRVRLVVTGTDTDMVTSVMVEGVEE